MTTITKSFVRASAIAAVLSALAFASPSYASPSGSSSGSSMQMGSGSGSKSQGYNPEEAAARIETRIQTLHDKLKVTPEQESEWNDVAQAMRDNESNLSQQIETKQANAKSMTAVEDLESYQKIAQAHADGTGKVISAFSTLYDDMSDQQKKNADQVFGQYEGHRGVAKASATKRKSSGGSMGSGSSSSGSSD